MNPHLKFPVMTPFFCALCLLGVLAACKKAVPPSAEAPVATHEEQPTAAESSTPAASAVTPHGDLRAFLDTQWASGAKVITVPPGVYHVTPVDKEHLKFNGWKDVTLVADGVEMICTETTRAITIENCENFTIKGLTIDYDPLPFTQGRIVEIAEDSSSFTVEILEGYPPPTEEKGSVEIYNPETGRVRARITHYGAQCKMEGPRRAVVTKGRSGPEFAIEHVGDIAVIRSSHAPGGSMPHAIMATDSKGLHFENVTLYAGPTFGFLENRCDNSRYIRCRVDKRPPESDPVPRAMPRLRSMNADAFHSKNARHGPIYDGCTAFHMGDDAVAINGDFHYITSAKGKVLRVLAKHTMNLHEGGEVQLFTRDGQRPPNRRIVSITPDGSITPEERRELMAQNLNENLKRVALEKAYRIVLDDASENIGLGTLICAADGIGNGFQVRNGRFGMNRSRGFVIKAGRGEITDNEILGSEMAAILVSPEYWWLEAGLADDLVIARNHIREGGGMGIVVLAIGGNGDTAPPGAFHNITVRDNTIEGGAKPGLLLASIRGLVEENNSVNPDPAKKLNPWEINAWGRRGLEDVMKINIEEQSVAP